MKRDLSSLGITVVLIPAILLILSALYHFLNFGPYKSVLKGINMISLPVKVVLFNVLFFTFPIAAIICGSLSIKTRKYESIISIILGAGIIIWYAFSLMA